MSARVRVFLDTNVLVYAFDNDEAAKQERAREILQDAGNADVVYVISTQVLQEFYSVVTRKLSSRLSEEDAERAVWGLAHLPVVSADTQLVLTAIALSRQHQLSLWDALILRAAEKADCSRLLTEDLQDGLQIGRVRVENPFTKIN